MRGFIGMLLLAMLSANSGVPVLRAKATEGRYRLIQSDTFVDMRTIARRGNLVSAWDIKFITADEDKRFDTLKSRITYDCDNYNSLTSTILFFREGKLIDSVSGNDTKQAVLPESVGERIFDFVCRGVVEKWLETVPLQTEAQMMAWQKTLK